MDIFSHVFDVKIEMFVWKDENKQKEVGDCQLKFYQKGLSNTDL